MKLFYSQTCGQATVSGNSEFVKDMKDRSRHDRSRNDRYHDIMADTAQKSETCIRKQSRLKG